MNFIIQIIALLAFNVERENQANGMTAYMLMLRNQAQYLNKELFVVVNDELAAMGSYRLIIPDPREPEFKKVLHHAELIFGEQSDTLNDFTHGAVFCSSVHGNPTSTSEVVKIGTSKYYR